MTISVLPNIEYQSLSTPDHKHEYEITNKLNFK